MRRPLEIERMRPEGGEGLRLAAGMLSHVGFVLLCCAA